MKNTSKYCISISWLYKYWDLVIIGIRFLGAPVTNSGSSYNQIADMCNQSVTGRVTSYNQIAEMYNQLLKIAVNIVIYQ